MQLVGTPSRRRLLVLAAGGVVCVGIAGVLLWLLSGFAGAVGSDTQSDQQVSATVVRSADCAAANAHDTVSFTVGGQRHQAPLNGCGNQPGQAMTVLVPADLTADTVVNPTVAAPGNPSGQARRVAFLLLVVAAAAGGACVYHLYRRRDGTERPSRGEPEAAFGAMPARSTASTTTVAETAAEKTGEPKNWFEDSSGFPEDSDDR